MDKRGPKARTDWPDRPYWEETAHLSDLAYNAYCTSDMFSDLQFMAEDEIRDRGYSLDELYNFVTWGDA
jgi:hypothetical protein